MHHWPLPPWRRPDHQSRHQSQPDRSHSYLRDEREQKVKESVKREIKWRVSGYHAAEAAAWRRLRKTLLLSSGASVSPCRQNDKFCVHSMVVHRPMKRAQSRTGTLGITSALLCYSATLLRCHSDGALSLLLFLFLLIGDMCCSTVRIKVKQSSVPRLGRVGLCAVCFDPMRLPWLRLCDNTTTTTTKATTML